MSELKFCPKCGKEKLDNAQKVCDACGFEFEKGNTPKWLIILLIIIAGTPILLFFLGIAAALTLPALVTRYENSTAQYKIKKAIVDYEKLTAQYMEENNKSSFANALTPNCDNANKYFRIMNQDGCNFETTDGAYWEFNPKTGNASVTDNISRPMHGVLLWTKDGTINDSKVRPNQEELKYSSHFVKCFMSANDFLSKTSSELYKCAQKRR